MVMHLVEKVQGKKTSPNKARFYQSTGSWNFVKNIII